ncbi:Rieske (2Fe-2S) protein [Thalassoglobus sp. JC818]|uniref:QcrA and Rieske domain-containing protein n=1 Tax=Thalassoglobus sp. JC818 TaxID=3232136 RepID=UPI003457C194
MSDEKKKLTTAEILALARKQKSEGGSADAPASDAEASAESSPASSESKPAAAPKSTADILAAARAQGGGKKESEESAKPAAPKSTADILAAARKQGGGKAAAPAGGAPKSTADILAAARAQKGGSGGAAATPAKAAPKAKAPAKPTEAGDRPALKDMVAAVAEAKKSGAPVKPKVDPSKPAAGKPKLPKKAETTTRRGFWGIFAAVAITPFMFAWASVSAIAGLWALGVARFMMPNMVLELPSRFKVGPKSDFPPGTVSEKFKASRGIWIVNTDQYDGRGMIYALASVCTHLGCTPNWLEGEQKFKCPCHGSGFYITGINFEGPAPRPLERVGIAVAPDGLLEVDKSVKFQEELGQWVDPKSFELA